jgi:NDP-sugar pyrophosphorylase family protein
MEKVGKMGKPMLVVLAAGMGSRYGGLKQMDALGKNGETLLDYSAYDALRSGFGSIVFIIRRDIEKDFEVRVLARFGGAIAYDIAYQEMDALIPAAVYAEAQRAGRTKLWGTAHALLCAREKIDAPFAVINADDFYGREAFDAIGEFLSKPDLKNGCIVPYSLKKTLSPKGTVTRGICAVKNGALVSVDELQSIARGQDGIFNTAPDGSKRFLPEDTLVSMNFWGFPPVIFADLSRYFDDFLALSGKELKSECYLPTFADWLVKNGLLDIEVLSADSEWFGVTYQEDKISAVNRIASLTAQGVYPDVLWK